LAYFKLSLLGGAAIAAPIIFYQVWAFVAPGLYAREKKFVIPFVVCSTGLFIGGGYFGWRLVFPMAFKYLLTFSGDVSGFWMFKDIELKVTPTVMMSEYIDFVTRMLLGFGLIFEIPLLLVFLSMAGVINYLHLIRYGRWFVVVAFLVAALLTPPEATSQVMMALPMLVLYGVSILLAYLFGKPPSEEQRAAYKKRNEEIKAERAADRERRRKQKEAEAREKRAQKKK
jgi:sec-independent protein translocase protein TatC